MFYIDRESNGISYGAIMLVESDAFDSLNGLTIEAGNRGWSKQTVTDIWNGFAGTAGPFADLKPCKCFKNRPYGLAKIWAAIQRLVPKEINNGETQSAATTRKCLDCGGEGCDECAGTGEILIDAPEQSATPILNGEVEEAPAMKAKNAARKPKKKAKIAKPVKATAKSDGKTKRDEVIRLMSRARGASTEELLEATGWLGHSLRGFVSTLGSKHGITIISEKDEKRGRVYRIAA